MLRNDELVVWLKDVDREDANSVGGKAANLGEMLQAKFPVPNGFALTSYSYFSFLQFNKLSLKIKHLLGTVNYNDPNSLNTVSSHIKRLIVTSKIPDEILHDVFRYYSSLGESNPLVAIRSSATSEDSKTASFAGQQETYLNVKGEANVVEKIKKAWASLYEARAIFYRHENRLDTHKFGIALVVQKMVESEASGVMFTVDPVTNDKSKIIIEAIYGLGEYIVQGRVTPDHYEVNKETFDIFNIKISKQDIMLKKVRDENKRVEVPLSHHAKQKITNDEIQSLAKLAKDIEKHYYFPQDIEWAKEKGKLYIVQTRPITTLGTKEKGSISQEFVQSHYKLILKGDPASPGIATGAVKLLRNTSDLHKIKRGEILVAPFTNPDYVPAMKKSAAIITERGGRTSHAAIVSREFGIPAIVGVHDAMTKLKDGLIVTVDGRGGYVYQGSILGGREKVETHGKIDYKTKTKVYVNLAEPERASTVASYGPDGIGLLRAEFMIAQIGIHPKKLIKEHKEKVFIDNLSHGLRTICKAFYPRPVIYRTTDFKTNEYRTLKGGSEFEPHESNPMLGYRGAYRYIHDPAVFRLEIEAVKWVRQRFDLTNLHVMIPFVRTITELMNVKKILDNMNLKRSDKFKLYMMVEIPSNVILLEEFIKCGIDGVSIGSNDLTMLLLGVDRDNEEIADVYDERDQAVLWALEKVIKTCVKYQIDSSICGQAPSNYPDLVEKLVKWGIHSISVSPDALDITRMTVFEAEKRLKSS